MTFYYLFIYLFGSYPIAFSSFSPFALEKGEHEFCANKHDKLLSFLHQGMEWYNSTILKLLAWCLDVYGNLRKFKTKVDHGVSNAIPSSASRRFISLCRKISIPPYFIFVKYYFLTSRIKSRTSPPLLHQTLREWHYLINYEVHKAQSGL